MTPADSGYLLHRDSDRLFVEAWSAWRLPFMNLTPAQSRYRDELRRAIQSLKANGRLHGIYTSQVLEWAADLENILFYNVGTSAFRAVGSDLLRFTRIDAAPPEPPAPLSFAARHHVRYQVGGGEASLDDSGAVLAEGRAICKAPAQLKDIAKLWKSFKAGMVSPAGARPTEGRLVLRMVVSAPAACRINLAEVMKPNADGFMSALHSYRGGQLEAVASRLSARLRCSPEEVRELLLRTDAAVLGPRAVPHLRGDGLQWSPADDLLKAGELVRETSGHDTISVNARISCVPAARLGDT